jgi:hypothetical protein
MSNQLTEETWNTLDQDGRLAYLRERCGRTCGQDGCENDATLFFVWDAAGLADFLPGLCDEHGKGWDDEERREGHGQ